MFVGHNPDMSLLVTELTGVDASMKKGGLARIDTVGGSADEGELVWLIAPKVFDALRDKSKPAKAMGDVPLAAPAQKRPTTSQPLHDLIANRWSPLAFDRARDIDRATAAEHSGGGALGGFVFQFAALAFHRRAKTESR